MTPELLARCTGARIDRAARFAEPLSVGMAFYDITGRERQSAFLAQIGHETAGLKWVSEIWGPTEAQEGYEGRLDLGNTEPGDGSRFRGHGLIQTTGRGNHARVRDRLRERFPNVPDFEEQPELLMEPLWAALSACDYWDMKGLNALADAGEFRVITKKINGGFNGLPDRLARLAIAQTALA